MTFDKHGYLKLLRGVDMTYSEYRVLVTMLSYSDGDGTHAHPGNARLAEDCDICERSVKNALVSLVKRGWLVKVKEGRGRGPGNPGVAAEYALTMPGSTCNRLPADSRVKVQKQDVFPGSQGAAHYPPPDHYQDLAVKDVAESPWGGTSSVAR
ncbi:hypothetical protein BN1232_02232 [Mycobacterium lentiflavum]|uniref:Helix-turn-helix domain-containing protein n=1 Tax=Mycobacterium lentiflavum TaxID=141349 RepID=A0A0E4H098_MYCLN|nr:helix-turn-helix domain-containing protein [Mycobacterium lentiflavum]ULP44272.1 helix-turn-helix domain-containing protein [Mycobacterium lentiflavum]CQD11855.1 hypothetical protein BN1232_02232 [Mycobacterium lentiflavum]